MTARAGRAARVAAVLLLAALPFHAGLVGGELIAWRDLPDHFYPRCHVIGEALARGELPRWDPLVFHGASWFGTRSPGVLYPGHVLFAVLPLGVAMAAFMTLHVALAALGGRALLGRVVGSDAAWAGGLAYGLGGFVVSQHWVLTYLISAALLPWAALGGLLAVERPWRGAALVAAAVGLTLVAVEPQGALVAAGASLGLALGAAPSGARWRAGLAVALGVGLAALLACTSLLPLLLELPRTNRTIEGWHDGRYGAPPLGLLLQLLAPGALGEYSRAQAGYWGHGLWSGEVPWCGLYVGVLGVAAAAGALGDRATRRLAWPGVALCAAGVGLAVVDPGRLVGLRFSAKWLVLTGLGLAWLVAAGWSRLGCWTATWVVRSYAAVAVLGALAAAASPVLWGAALAADPSLHADDVRRAAGGAAIRLGAAALAALALLRVSEGDGAPARRAQGLLLSLLALDLVSAGAQLVPATEAPLLTPPPLASLVHATSTRPVGPPPTLFTTLDTFRRFEVDPLREDPHERMILGIREVLRPNVGQLHGIRSIAAFESTTPRALQRFFHAALRAGLPATQALALLDAEVFVAPSSSPYPRLPDVLPLGGALNGRRAILKNLACPPWAYVAGEARAAASEEAAVAAAIASERVITRSAVLGPEGADLAGEASPVVSATVGEVEFAAERVALTVTSDAPGWLVVRESFSSDWKATLDGAPAPMARADALFRALRVPAGRSRVVMVYDPWWWTPSLLLSALGLAGLAGLVVLDRRGNREVAGGTS